RLMPACEQRTLRVPRLQPSFSAIAAAAMPSAIMAGMSAKTCLVRIVGRLAIICSPWWGGVPLFQILSAFLKGGVAHALFPKIISQRLQCVQLDLLVRR